MGTKAHVVIGFNNIKISLKDILSTVHWSGQILPRYNQSIILMSFLLIYVAINFQK